MSIVISVENISKQYKLGVVSTGTLVHDLNRWFYRILRKEDPYSKITEVNERDKYGEAKYVWALKDINFKVSEGEVIGIIGRNGAGKSTLLKILSKVTSPTAGQIKIKGKIASLLEVGTGFHPELTGRENIFLNGSILGMSRNEISSKLNEIVEFAGVQKYLDTPVKRYSSGMYVRLAFSVAAHLETDILIVDEVLAVGDAEFQRKCLNKMKDVSRNGKTVLFVSHNLIAIENMCTSALLMSKGQIQHAGSVNECINLYYKETSSQLKSEFIYEDHGLGFRIFFTPEKPHINENLYFDIEIKSHSHREINVAIDILGMHDEVLFGTGHRVNLEIDQTKKVGFHIPKNLMNSGMYYINIYLSDGNMKPIVHFKEALSMEYIERGREYRYLGKVNGLIRPEIKWKTFE